MTRSIPEYVPSNDLSGIKPFENKPHEAIEAMEGTVNPAEVLGVGKLKAEGKTTKELTQERGAVYGPPIKHFSCTTQTFNRWLQYRRQSIKSPASAAKEDAIRHSVYMILDKLSRLAHTIDHKDSWDDIQGYAECAKKILFGEKK
jgi:hypothetical protein